VAPSDELLTDVCSCGHRHAKALRDSLLPIFNHIAAVENGNEKLERNKKELQRSMEELTSMHQITTLDSDEKY
jgi:hypothetical protein